MSIRSRETFERMLQAMLGGIAGATVRISIDEEQCQFPYGRILEGIAQALKLSSTAPAAHVVAHRVMRVVTSGSAYLDIDAYACCIAYTELLNHQASRLRAVSSAPLNASISRTVLGWQSSLDDYRPRAGDEFVLVDVSDYHHFDPMVVLDQVVKSLIITPGFESYWAQKLGSRADILPIGAAATQIFQRWEAAELLSLISENSAALLATAILDNTLNFHRQLTTQSDIRAYDVLSRRAKLAATGPNGISPSAKASIESDLIGALAADMKRLKAESNLPQVFAQMTVWDAAALIRTHRSTISHWLAAQGGDWLLNVISIRECKSYFLAEPLVSQQKLSHLLPIEWQAGTAVLERSLLRKELLKLGWPASPLQTLCRG